MGSDPQGGRDHSSIESVDATPAWAARGDHGIRIREMSGRHKKLLNNIQVDLGGVTRREGIAALLEYYHEHPGEVLAAVQAERFR